MEEVKPTVISTFAGCGGSSLGYHLAGFRELLAVEWDDNAVQTFKLNFPDVPIYHGDIAQLSVEQCMKLAGLSRSGELDVFDGSPPCQGFSTAGKRKFNDPRNSLFREYARLLKGLQPKVFVMENVTGMIKGYMKQAYLQIIEELRSCGYKAKGQVMNAMYYNVPQSRERVIIVGVREDLGIEPSHPKPQTKPITVREALEGVTDIDAPMIPEWLRNACKDIPDGCWDGPFMVELFRKYKGTSGGALSTKLLSWGKYSCTLLKNEIADACIIHPSGDRRLSIQELKRLASFPDVFDFGGNRINAVERIGNSVPPNLMRAIALHIKENILTSQGTLE